MITIGLFTGVVIIAYLGYKSMYFVDNLFGSFHFGSSPLPAPTQAQDSTKEILLNAKELLQMANKDRISIERENKFLHEAVTTARENAARIEATNHALERSTVSRDAMLANVIDKMAYERSKLLEIAQDILQTFEFDKNKILEVSEKKCQGLMAHEWVECFTAIKNSMVDLSKEEKLFTMVEKITITFTFPITTTGSLLLSNEMPSTQSTFQPMHNKKLAYVVP